MSFVCDVRSQGRLLTGFARAVGEREAPHPEPVSDVKLG
jgi:hypothetical protein